MPARAVRGSGGLLGVLHGYQKPGAGCSCRGPAQPHPPGRTYEQSLARILFGGKALVTVRERSVLTITEAPGVSTLRVGLGKIGVAVVKERVKPGEAVEIRTPNAVATIRGTVVIAEVSPETSEAGGGAGLLATTITVLKGVVELRRLDALTRQPIGPAVTLRAVESVRVTGAAALPSPYKLSPEAAQRLVNEWQVNVKEMPGARGPLVTGEMRRVTNTSGVAVGGTRGAASASPSTGEPGATSSELGSGPRLSGGPGTPSLAASTLSPNQGRGSLK